MQRYSPEIPWVLVAESGSPRSARVSCTVCGDGGIVMLPAIGHFAAQHAEHRSPAGTIGLGDVVASVAKPIAGALGMAPCTPCEERRRALNAVHVGRRR